MGDKDRVDPLSSTPRTAADLNDSEDRATPRTFEVTLRTFALAAVASLAQGPSSPGGSLPEIEFLLQHLTAVAPDRTGWASRLPSYLHRPAPVDLPLLQLSEEIGLTPVEVLSVALAAAVEEDPMVGRAVARLQAPLGGSRPTLGLLAAALAGLTPRGLHPLDSLITGAASRSGLLLTLGEGAPLPERSVAVPLPLCLALRGRDGVWPGTTLGAADLGEVPLPPSVLEEVGRRAGGLVSAPNRALVLRTGSMMEGRSVASAFAGAMQRRPLFIDTDKTTGIGPWLLLRRLLPVFSFDLAPGERKKIPPLAFYSGPVLVICGPDGSIETDAGGALAWTLPVPPPDERRALWETALGDRSLAADLSRHHRHGVGRIAHLGRLARHQGLLNGRSSPAREDLAAAAWSGEGGGLNALAQPLKEPIPDEALVTTPALRAELNTLLLRCRTRDGLADGLGISAAARYRPGVRALFVGPSGTGKTLAAGWLATKLGLPLYRVDLAAITSKYIGETEKNLAQLLARAEQAEVVLLFDEADSLFGKRTDVKEANDRFANAQTNYLLQRIESYDGITLLTSNSRTRFDSAFSRRLDMIVDFPLPGPEERRELWQSHLGTKHRLTPKELNQLAATADLCGGHIRNAVLTAAVLAQEGERKIEYGDIVQGLMSEYRKQSRQLPAELMKSL